MEEAKVKKEIVVKRLSAFKFAVEVNSNSELPPRVSVIQRAPPASPLPAPQSSQDTVFIRLAIMQRIVEMLLWKLLGEPKLRTYCGYPTASPSTLLWRVVHYSLPQSAKNTLNNHDCSGNETCFTEHVTQFLKICAPTEELWIKFGWNKLSTEAILRKIYDEELSPHMSSFELQTDINMRYVCADMQLLLQWERQGYTAVSWGGNKYFSALLPSSTWDSSNMSAMQANHPGLHYLRKVNLHEDGRRKMEGRRGGGGMSHYGVDRRSLPEWISHSPLNMIQRHHRKPYSRGSDINLGQTSFPQYHYEMRGIMAKLKNESIS